jgi:hypothetical protein
MNFLLPQDAIEKVIKELESSVISAPDPDISIFRVHSDIEMLRELATITYPDGTNQVLLAAFEN